MEEGDVVSAAAPEVVEEAKDTPQEKPQGDAEKSPNESEYDSAGSYSDEERDKGRARNSQERSESDSEGSVGLERESGDGQESIPTKKVDDDEDKKNPQYIPKRGTFYEHDDRTLDDDANSNTAELEKEKDPKKKVWQDKKERWGHDRFNDSDQAPKSRAELVSIYGYDIRNEDGPPRARRRRRYGRGPNKYTRNWEDEDAYSKPPPPRTKRPPKKGSEEFPPLNPSPSGREDDRERPKERPDDRTSERSDSHTPETNGNARNAPQYVDEPTQPSAPPVESARNQQRVGSGRVIKPKREIQDSDYRGFTTKTRQVRNMKTDQKVVPKQRRDDLIQTRNFTNRTNVQDLERDMSKLNVQDGGSKGKHGGGQRQGSVPPRLQSEQKGSKRYSSIRQRSLPESATPPFSQPQHSGYYPNEFNQNQVIHQNAQIHPSSPQVPQIAPPPLPPIPQVPVTATPILQAPQFAPPFPQAPPFLQAGPPPFLPQQTPQIINYVPSQPQFPQGYQGYQQQFNPVTPPELYQPPSGITYYSTDQQVTQQRLVPLKRPKAAIPIVAPPPIDFKGKMKDDDVSSYEGDISGNSDGQTGDSSSTQELNIQVQQ